jgi:hypothetical protein
MRAMSTVVCCALSVIIVAPAAHAQIHWQTQGGMNQYPQTDDEARLIRRDLPPPVKISRSTLPGDIVARGRHVQRTTGRTAGSDCAFDFGFEIELQSGSREVVLRPQPDCTVTLESVTDVDVVEPQEHAVASVKPGIFATARHVTGKLWEALFPTAFAQTDVLRTLYHHIYTCGIGCSGGIDGLTAQQGWLNYRYNYTQAKLDTAYAWFCMAGSAGGYSYCQDPMHVAYAPMAPVNTGWTGYGGVMYRNWGWGSQVSAGDYSTYQWIPVGQSVPPAYIHTLYNERKANYNGSVSCVSWISGSIVNGPVRSSCVPVPR